MVDVVEMRPARAPSTRVRPPEVTILCGMCGAASVALFALYLWPLSPKSPAGTDGVLSAFGAVLTLCLLRVRRVPRVVLHLVVLVWLGGITWGVIDSATPQGATGSAVTYTWTLLYTAYFFTERQARGYAALTSVLFLAACVVAPFQGIVAVFLVVTLTCVGGCELLLRMLQHLRTAALRDELTGQPNRTALVTEGAEAIRQARRRGAPLTVALLDLDHFKQINDERGHAAGDAVLQQVTQWWSEQLRTGDSLYRSGGDEFVLLLPGAAEREATSLLRRLQAASPAPWCFGLAEIRPDDDLDRALARADQRLYEAKTARPSIPAPRHAAQPRSSLHSSIGD